MSAVPILALDTSSAVAVAVVSPTGEILAARSADEPRHHAELLAPMVAEALEAAGVARTDLAAVVAGTGPAPFTGLRVGLVTARTLALALDVPAWGMPSVDALAAAAARTADPGTRVLVVTDARRREVYWCEYVTSNESITVTAGPDIAAPAVLVESGRVDGALVVGRGALLYADALGLRDEPTPLDPDPAELARLAIARAAAGGALPTTPLYLRHADATPPAAPKRART